MDVYPPKSLSLIIALHVEGFRLEPISACFKEKLHFILEWDQLLYLFNNLGIHF
jgi:hypothetical protein